MQNQIVYISIGGLIGFLSTIITQNFLQWLRRERVKKTIKAYLLNIIHPKIDKLFIELETLSTAISVYSSDPVKLGMHPTFNSSVLKSFAMSDLHAIYNENFNTIINIIGYLDNMSERLPHGSFKNYVAEINDHMDEHFEKHKEDYPTEKDHYQFCPGVKAIRGRYLGNIENVRIILLELRENIGTISKVE